MKLFTRARAPRTATALAAVPVAALLALGGAGAAQAGTCPAGQHWNEMGGGAGFCSIDATGGGTGGPVTIDLGGGAIPPSYGEPMAPPVVNRPAAPVYGPMPAPAPPAQYSPPTANIPAYVAPTPIRNQAPAAPAQVQVPNQPVKGAAPAENPVIAGVPAEAQAAEATPTATPDAVTRSETSTAATSATPSPAATPATAVTYDQSASTGRFEPWPYILCGLLIAALVAVQVARARIGRRTTEASNGGSMEAGSSDA